MRHVTPKPSNECWLWTGSVSPEGYGRLGDNKYAHRAFYEIFIGGIPTGMDLDHLCRVRRCVNPWHLEPVTRRENVYRSPISPAGVNKRKTHCVNGHEFTPKNTLYRTNKYHTLQRICRECNRKKCNDRYRAAHPVRRKIYNGEHGTWSAVRYHCKPMCKICQEFKRQKDKEYHERKKAERQRRSSG